MSEALRLAEDLRRQFMNAEHNFGTMVEASIALRRLASVEQELEALKRTISEAEPVAYLYSLEYGNTTVNVKCSEWKLNYPFGVCGADYLRSNDNGMSYVRETPLYTIKGIK